MSLPEYTVRIAPDIRQSSNVEFAFGEPRVMLVDGDGNEVARLKGISDVTVNMGAQTFASVDVTLSLFEVEGVKTMLSQQKGGEWWSRSG